MKKKIIFLLLCAVILCALCACGSNHSDNPATHSDIPTQREIQKMAKEAEEANEAVPVIPVPENPAAAERPAETVVTLKDADGETVQADGKLLSGVFADGPSFSFYGEKKSMWYDTVDGYVLTVSGMEDENACSLDLRFLRGKTAEQVAPGLLEGFDEIRSLEDMGTTVFAGRSARYVRGNGENFFWQAWVIDLPEGAVAVTMHAVPSEKNAMLRMETFANTLELVSNQ